jgi:two-component system, cell cycle response regulator
MRAVTMSDETKPTDPKLPAAEPRAATNAEGPSPEELPSRPSTPRASLPDWADEESSTRTTHSVVVVPAQGKQRTRALLTIVGGSSAGRVYPMREDETTIGRGKEAHVRLDDAGTSRLHARIVFTAEGSYLLEDLSSTNGTFLRGKRIEREELSSGDRIHIGPDVVMSFAILDSTAVRLTHQLYESSVRDPLTRAHNRRYLVERLASEVAYARRHKARLGVLLFDLDSFKLVNDTHGHLAGDEVLRQISALVIRMIRTEDVFARFGGEEFVVIVRGIEYANVSRFAERLRAAVERLEIQVEDVALRVTISVGFATFDELPDVERTPDGLLRIADERLYRAKTAGRNQTCGA